MKNKGAISKKGYLPDSPDRFNMFNVIPSNDITMKGVKHNVMMIPIGSNGIGNPVMGTPGNNYLFPRHDAVVEIPMFAQGGSLDPDKARQMLLDGVVYNRPLTEAQRQYFASVAGTDLEGNYPEDDTEETDVEEFRYGGQKRLPRSFTSKNIKSSINFLLRRNKMLYGQPGKRYYIPNTKQQYGGQNLVPINRLMPTQDLSKKDPKVIASLMNAINNGEDIPPIEVELKDDNLRIKDGHHRYIAYTNMGITNVPITDSKNSDMMKKKKGGIAFPQQPTMNQFFSGSFVPNSPVGFYMKGGNINTNGIAFPQQPTAQEFFLGALPFQMGGTSTHPGGTQAAPNRIYLDPSKLSYDEMNAFRMNQIPQSVIPQDMNPGWYEFGVKGSDKFYPYEVNIPGAEKEGRGPGVRVSFKKGGKPCYNCGGMYMKHGGDMMMKPYHSMSQDQYDKMYEQMYNMPKGFHMMPDGTMMSDSEMQEYKKGGVAQRGYQIGQEYDVDNQELTRLRNMGYTFMEI